MYPFNINHAYLRDATLKLYNMYDRALNTKKKPTLYALYGFGKPSKNIKILYAFRERCYLGVFLVHFNIKICIGHLNYKYLGPI